MSALRMHPGDLADTTDSIRRMLAEIANLIVTWGAIPEKDSLNDLRERVISGLSHTEMLERAVESWSAEQEVAP